MFTWTFKKGEKKKSFTQLTPLFHVPARSPFTAASKKTVSPANVMVGPAFSGVGLQSALVNLKPVGRLCTYLKTTHRHLWRVVKESGWGDEGSEVVRGEREKISR